MQTRWTSRKFLLALGAQIAALLVLLFPQKQSEIAQVSQSVTALVVLLLSTLGYVHAEASVDRANKSDDSEPVKSDE